MGNWFSSTPEIPTPTRQYHTEPRSRAPPPRAPPSSTTYTNQYQSPSFNEYQRATSFAYQGNYGNYGGVQPRAQQHTEPQLRTSIRGPNLTATVHRKADTQNWETRILSQNAYKLVDLDISSTDYKKAYRMFRATAQKQLKIQKIQRVENPYLFGSYILKREECNSRSQGLTKETNYFHGTKRRNLDAICSNNFDWRLHGDSLGNRYGKGMSFSPIANYSSHYCDNKPNCENVMFLARVLVTNSIVGSKDMIIPPHGYDTAKKEDNRVVVKFCDNEFYPEFVIYYTGKAEKSVKPRA